MKQKQVDDNFPDVIGKSTPLERKAREMASDVEHVEFPEFDEDPEGWKIARQIHLNPWLGFQSHWEWVKGMGEEDKMGYLAALREIRDLYHKTHRE